MPEHNRAYKDRLFKFIFANPDYKEWTLSLYNAVNRSHYTDVSALTYTTIENAVYMGMHNDVSFLIADTLSFYEQQSTFNPNMPLRMLMYAAMVYSKLISAPESRLNLFSRLQQKVPAPKLVCFYNGETAAPEEQILALSDAFPEGSEPDIEARVKMLNINYGRNRELLSHCRPLNDYSLFVEEVREQQKIKDDMAAAVEAAIRKLPDDSPIKPFILANKAEVTMMCITEYDEKKTMNLFKEEGRAEGLAKGIAKGRAEGIAKGRAEGIADAMAALVLEGILSVEDAARRAGMSESEFRKHAHLTA